MPFAPVQSSTDPRGDRPRVDEIDVVRLVRERWTLFRNVCLGFIGLVIVVLLVLPSSYSTSAVVMLEPRKNNVTEQTSVLSETPTDPASIQNQIQLLTSRDLAARVIERLGLANDPEFAGTPGVSLNPLTWLRSPSATGDTERHDAVVSAFLKHLSAEAVGLSTTFKVTFTSRDPDKAAAIADTVVETYLDMQAALRFDVAQRTSDWLLSRIHQLGQEEQAAEVNIQRYKAEHSLADTANGGSLTDQQLVAINTQLVTAREDLAVKQAENARIVSLVDSGRAADVSQIVSSPLIIQLREQQADLVRDEAQLSARYGEKHPKLIAAESQKRDLDAKIAEEVDRIEGSVQNDVAVAQAQVRSLEDSFARAEHEAAEENMARVRLQSLEANAQSTRGMYEAFVSRLRETQGENGLETVDAREISRAPIPNAPSWPPRLIIAAASMPAGLLLGLLAVLLAEKLEGAAAGGGTRERDLARDPFRGVPVLAELPQVAALSAPEVVVDQPASAPALTLRALAQHLVAQRPRVVIVTSADPRQGQTSVALGLARAASQLGARVVLLDGSLRGDTAVRRLGLPQPSRGFVDVLRGTARLSQSLQRDARSSVLIASGCPRGAAPQEVWASERMAQLMRHLRQSSDLVVIDGAPIAEGGELPLVAKASDALIVVAMWNGVPQQDLAAALDYLKANTNLAAGLVLAR